MQLIQLIKSLQSLSSDKIMNRWEAPLRELADKLAEERFSLVVVGLFKRGKSSIINALLQKRLAPVAVTPLTAIVTLFEYDEIPHAAVYFENGEIKEVAVEQISQFVSEEENPNNEKKVKLVKVYDNAVLLKTTIVADTPGMGSVFEHNTDSTIEFIPKIDAALFVLSADLPISKIDIELLDSLQQTVPKIFFVVNKSDLLSPPDLAKLIVHNKKILAGKLNTNEDAIDLQIISAKDPLRNEEHINSLRENIQQFISKEKEGLVKQNVSHNVKRILKEMILELRLRLDSWMMPLDELEHRKQQFFASLQLMQQQKEEFDSIIAGKIKKLQQQVAENVNNLAGHTDSEISQRLQMIITDPDQPIHAQHTDSIKSSVEKYITDQFTFLKNELEISVRDDFKLLLNNYVNRSQSFMHEMATNLKSLMDVDIDLIAGSFDLNVYTAFYLSPDSSMGNTALYKPFGYILLPDYFWRRKLYEKLYSHYHEIIVRNSASVGYDLQYKIQESFRRFNYDLQLNLQQLLKHIENILAETVAQKMQTQTDTIKETEPLEKLLMEIESINEELPFLKS